MRIEGLCWLNKDAHCSIRYKKPLESFYTDSFGVYLYGIWFIDREVPLSLILLYNDKGNRV